MKGKLFVCYVGDLPIHNTSCHVLGTIGKSSTSRDAPSWFHNVSTYGGKMIDY